jgi:hypothetical protein
MAGRKPGLENQPQPMNRRGEGLATGTNLTHHTEEENRVGNLHASLSLLLQSQRLSQTQ